MDIFNYNKKSVNLKSNLEYVGDLAEEELFKYFDKLNQKNDHMSSNDDICTPMSCVKLMVDYLPKELWKRKDLKILEPCAGNGNFGAYISKLTSIDNIWFNEINKIRYNNCVNLLNPKHVLNADFFCLPNDWVGKYDLIVANPPYSGGGNKNKSLSNQFIEKSIDMLKDDGYLCYISPNNWMSYNNKNTTLWKLLNLGSFLVIDNNCKKFFNGVGSSFTIIVWQKGRVSREAKIINNYVINDVQNKVNIPKNLDFLPLYISKESISLSKKLVKKRNDIFYYRCDLHNFTQKEKLNDNKNSVFKYRTIHTAKKTRYATFKQDIYSKWVIIVPLSTYFKPYIEHNVNVTQSVGYIAFDEKTDAQKYLNIISQPQYKTIIHLTRYGNFNNIMVLKHLDFTSKQYFTENEKKFIDSITSGIRY